MTYQERLERRYDVVYWNTTFKIKTLEKNENFWLSPQKEKLEENFSMTQKNANLASIPILFNMSNYNAL